MNEFADATPLAWFDDTRVLVTRAPVERRQKNASGLMSQVRGVLSSVVLGLAVVGLTSQTVSSSDDIVRATHIANDRAENGLSRSYWQGLAHALSRAPSYVESDDVEDAAPLL